MTRLLCEQRQQAAEGEIRAQVAVKVGVLGEKFKGLAEKIEGFLDKLKDFESICIKSLVSVWLANKYLIVLVNS